MHWYTKLKRTIHHHEWWPVFATMAVAFLIFAAMTFAENRIDLSFLPGIEPTSQTAIYFQYFTATPSSVSPGQTSVLRMHCQDQDGYKIYGPDQATIMWSGGAEDVTVTTPPLYSDTTYYGVCDDNRVTNIVYAYAQVHITIAYNPPVFNYFTSSSASVNYNDSVTLSWSVTPSNRGTSNGLYMYGGRFGSGGTSMSGWSNAVNSGLLTSNTTFQMGVTDSYYGTVWSSQNTVTVAAAPTPAPKPPTSVAGSCSGGYISLAVTPDSSGSAPTSYYYRMSNPSFTSTSACPAGGGWYWASPTTCALDNYGSNLLSMQGKPGQTYQAWVHAANGPSYVSNGSQTPGINTTATYSNSFSCAAADLCPGLSGTQTTYPSGSSPANSCTCPTGTTFDSGTNSCVVTDLCPGLAGTQATYPSGSSPANSCTCPSGTAYDQASNSCRAVGTISTLLTAKVNGTAATGLSVGQSAALTGTFTPPTGDTLTYTSISDNTGTSLTGASGAASPRSYTFVPTGAGSFIFYARAASTQYPTPSNYSSLILTVCQATETWNGSSCQATAVGQPTLTISGNGTANAVAVTLGQPVTIRGTYTAATGDTLVFTALNDNSNNALPGVSNTDASTPKTYTFTATAPGSFVFYPAARTAAYPTWNNYGKSLVVTVSCPAGQTQQGNTCAVPVQSCPGAHQVGTPPNCSCDVGFSMQGGQCVQVQCPGQNEVNWPACTCASGYVRDSGTNMCILQPVLSIKVNGLDTTRVRKGNSVTITWSASGVTAASCAVKTTGGVLLGSGASGSVQATVGAQTTYRLTCQNEAGSSVSKDATVTLIPTVIEQ